MSGGIGQRLRDARTALDEAVQLLPPFPVTARERQLDHAVWFACTALRSIRAEGYFFRLGDKLGQQIGGNHVMACPTWQQAVEGFAQREEAGHGRVLTVPYTLSKQTLRSEKELLHARIARKEVPGVGLTVHELDQHRLLVRVQLAHHVQSRSFLLDLGPAAAPPEAEGAEHGQQHGTPEPLAQASQGGEDGSGIHAGSVAQASGTAAGALLARRHAAAWLTIAKALAAEQLTDEARAAVERLNDQVETFAARNGAAGLPAVLIEATAELIANIGRVALHLGDDKFAFVGAQGNQAGPSVDGDHGGNGHGGTLQSAGFGAADVASA